MLLGDFGAAFRLVGTTNINYHSIFITSYPKPGKVFSITATNTSRVDVLVLLSLNTYPLSNFAVREPQAYENLAYVHHPFRYAQRHGAFYQARNPQKRATNTFNS
jgi:hypothetical protein